MKGRATACSPPPSILSLQRDQPVRPDKTIRKQPLFGHLPPPSAVHRTRLQGKSQIVGGELVRLGEQMVHSAEGTRAIALELCREFEDKFLEHIATGEVSNFL
ncbi:hypothetical protein HHK36_007735 [Tetracentron sinense]|uniref:Uncharacterized protein n=1 Tax=Tetracentron sinense TaxID=13715 RepID=A0A834ZE95_TETSI|nr:hypothetical protein HHK36_007735 [Tetracentron sinense]